MKKKIIKFSFFLLIILIVFTIYHYGKNDKKNYIALGDSITEGMNPYGEINYSYSDYVKEELNHKKLLRYYSKEYAKSGYTTIDVINSIKNNNTLKKDLRESNLVTISIGANDFLHRINKNSLDVNELIKLKSKLEDIFPNVDECLNEIRKYAKEDIIIVGYYNPIPFLFNTSSKDLDQLFAYIDLQYQVIAKKYNCKYISLYQLFKKNPDYLPNPSDIHPNQQGYQAIAKQVLATYLK